MSILEVRFKTSEANLKDEFGPNEIAAWDSLEHLQLVSELEDQYDIELDMDQINGMRTIGDIKRILAEAGAADV